MYVYVCMYVCVSVIYIYISIKVHVFKAEYGSNVKSTAAPTLSQVKTLSSKEPIVAIEQFHQGCESVLAYGNQIGQISGLDLRTRQSCFNIQHDLSLGVLTAMCVGPSPYALCTGTSRGFVHIWDLRYQMHAQNLRHSDKNPIAFLRATDSKGSQYIYTYIYIYTL